MATATITAEGYIAVPKDILDRLHLHAGDNLDVQVEDGQSMRIRTKPRTFSEIAGMRRPCIRTPAEVSGMLASRPHASAPVEDLDEALAEAFRRGEV